MLESVPPEILTHIAYHLALPTLSPPVPLLQSCKAINHTLSTTQNPRLYGRIFRSAFDSAAAERRIGDIHAGDVAQELKRRVVMLRRVGEMTRREEVEGVKVSDLWIIYVMLIENDGKNILHFIGPEAILPLSRFLKLYQANVLLPAGLEPGYPAETIERSLFMWIAWLLAGYESALGVGEETIHERDERLFVLRPYVFAPQQYELCFAPWTIADLPINEPQAPIDSSNPFIADLTPKSRLTTVQHYGGTIKISAPMLSHAAILLFFVKRPGGKKESSADVPLPMVALGQANGEEQAEGEPGPTADELAQAAASAVAAGTDSSATSTNGTAALIAAAQAQAVAAAIAAAEDDEEDEEDGDETFGAIRDLISNSRNHDRDFARMRACYDPFSCKGMKRAAWRGSWEGCWEGNFSFFDFDAFREMLAGQSRALYEGPFGEQAQVWRLTETWVWRRSWGVQKRKQRQKEKEERDRRRQEAIDAGVDVEAEDTDADKGKARVRGLPLTGPATNAGFPTDLPSSTSAGLASRAAEEITLKETIKQQVDALEGYEVVPDEELEEVLNEDDGGEEAGLETILTGVGHSAWGRFILKGKVRAWDGMASLVKEYAPDSRGKWIYRGYVMSGDIFVGRWRDTFTPEAYVGYEGTFILNRR